nr:MGMT family protein [Nakamurella aerolata]
MCRRVYAIARLVPTGRVVSYGDIAGMLQVNPRLVGRAMSLCDDLDTAGPDAAPLPWWRVTSSTGGLPDRLLSRARTRWYAEHIAEKANGNGARITRHRADLAALADAAERQLGPLPGVSG